LIFFDINIFIHEQSNEKIISADADFADLTIASKEKMC